MVRVTRKQRKQKTRALNQRSRITNGSRLLPCVDGRSIWGRRFQDLIELHQSDLGGEAQLSTAENSIIRRCAVLTVELEHLEVKFFTNGEATPDQLMLYQRVANTLHRLLQCIGMKRVPKEVTPSVSEYLRRSKDRLELEAA